MIVFEIIRYGDRFTKEYYQKRLPQSDDDCGSIMIIYTPCFERRSIAIKRKVGNYP